MAQATDEPGCEQNKGPGRFRERRTGALDTQGSRSVRQDLSSAVRHASIPAGIHAEKPDTRTAKEVCDRLRAGGVLIPERSEFQLLVAKHKPFMSTRKAEAKARQELET